MKGLTSLVIWQVIVLTKSIKYADSAATKAARVAKSFVLEAHRQVSVQCANH